MDALIVELQRTVRKPPQTVSVTTEPPSESDQEDSAHVLLPGKRKRKDPRLGVLIPNPVQNISRTIPKSTPIDQDFESHIVEQELFPSEGVKASGNSFKALELDISKGKSKLPELEFVDISASSCGPTNLTSQPASERVVIPALDANLDTFLSSDTASAQERRKKQIRVEHPRGKMLVMKHSDQNAPGDHPEMFLREIGKKVTDKYGDRSGILMWGYDADKKMWIVKRKSGQIEYYEKKVDFLSLTKVDLFELIHAPFHNPTNDPMAWSCKSFLEDKAKNNFEGMKTVSSFTKKAKDVIDPRTNKTMVNVMWLPTKQAK
ncbi:unnamed protein product [Lactuca saligna]|nr:unnamed protein product [Lactuca saligna]